MELSLKIDERIESASLGGTAPPIFPMGVARPNAASGRGDSGFQVILQNLLGGSSDKGEKELPRSNQGRKGIYNSCETGDGKTRPRIPDKGPGGSRPRYRLELLGRGPRRGSSFSPFGRASAPQVLPDQLQRCSPRGAAEGGRFCFE